MTKALREMHGKYIGNRPVKVRKSTWQERGVQSASAAAKWEHSLATVDAKAALQHKANPKIKKKTHVHKKKKGMPW